MAAGRPTDLTPEIQKAICKYISLGNFRKVAAEAVGISSRTMTSWCALGRKASKGIHYEFLRAVLEAERKAEIKCVGYVITAAASDPKHAEWWLEHKYPERWSSAKDRMREIEKDMKAIKELLGERKAVESPPTTPPASA